MALAAEERDASLSFLRSWLLACSDVDATKVAALCDSVHVVYPDPAFAATYGRLLSHLQRRGETIATMDLLIATTSVCADAPLLSRNIRHLERVPGLRLLAY
jgi:predicted nucleic acid-binding protein